MNGWREVHDTCEHCPQPAEQTVVTFNGWVLDLCRACARKAVEWKWQDASAPPVQQPTQPGAATTHDPSVPGARQDA